MTQLIDCHSHTGLSCHGLGTIKEAVNRALELDLYTYAQTEHLILPPHIDPHYEVSMASHVMQDYREELLQIRKQLKNAGKKMNLIIGVEADWLNDRGPEIKQLVGDFEYVLGSVHYIDEWPFDHPDYIETWDEYGSDNVWRMYFEKFLDMANSVAPIDCFSHPDLPKKFGVYPQFDATPYYEKMASAVKKRDAMIEVNTAGLRKPVHELYPSLDMLKIFREFDVDCTVGCDAHCPQDIGANILEAYELMNAAGYDKLTVPMVGHDRQYLALS
ncbi:MAG: histidinol-phosphatase [Coriobacteriales bacterium]|nr:histidinol-phosphatase [Coriobacteriales bacterium]